MPDTTDSKSSQPQKWWQWVLLYPALITTAIAAIPTFLELGRSASVKVPYGQSLAAIQQNDLWAKNLSCSTAPFDGLVNEFNIAVDAIICKSGDVLVRFKNPRGKTSYKWVPVESFEAQASSFFPVRSANAFEPILLGASAAPQEAVLCQVLLPDGYVLRRVSDPRTKQCFDEKIRTYTGEVVERRPAPCDRNCSQR